MGIYKYISLCYTTLKVPLNNALLRIVKSSVTPWSVYISSNAMWNFMNIWFYLQGIDKFSFWWTEIITFIYSTFNCWSNSGIRRTQLFRNDLKGFYRKHLNTPFSVPSIWLNTLGTGNQLENGFRCSNWISNAILCSITSCSSWFNSLPSLSSIEFRSLWVRIAICKSFLSRLACL